MHEILLNAAVMARNDGSFCFSLSFSGRASCPFQTLPRLLTFPKVLSSLWCSLYRYYILWPRFIKQCTQQPGFASPGFLEPSYLVLFFMMSFQAIFRHSASCKATVFFCIASLWLSLHSGGVLPFVGPRLARHYWHPL